LDPNHHHHGEYIRWIRTHKVVDDTTQLIDIFPTIMELAAVPSSAYSATVLDGFSLVPFVKPPTKPALAHSTIVHTSNASIHTSNPSANTSNASAAAGSANVNTSSTRTTHTERPNFVVSQFHGDNLGMSWFMVVQKVHINKKVGDVDGGKAGQVLVKEVDVGGDGGHFKLIVWGTGAEVPNMLFNLDSDPDEQHNLIKNRGSHQYTDVVALLDKNLRSVVDYTAVAQQVAHTYQQQFRLWQALVPDWRTEIRRADLRWRSSWDANSSAAFAAIEEWLSHPAEVLPCRSALQWPVEPHP
jgi:hypothetical protein